MIAAGHAAPFDAQAAAREAAVSLGAASRAGVAADGGRFSGPGIDELDSAARVFAMAATIARGERLDGRGGGVVRLDGRRGRRS